MRVLVISWEYPPYLQGAWPISRSCSTLCRRPDMVIHVVTPQHSGSGEAYEAHGNLIVHRVNTSLLTRDHTAGGETTFFENVLHVNKGLEQFIELLWQQVGGFDLIHTHDWLVSFVAWTVHRTYDVPLIVTVHATERSSNRGWL